MSMSNIELQLENGVKLSAPFGVWLAAILATSPAEQQTAIKEQVGQMMEQQERSNVLPEH